MPHGDYPSNPETINDIEDPAVEKLLAKFENNVIKFPEKQPFKYDDLEGKSMQILDDMGYHSIEEAKVSLEEMKAKKETFVLTFTQKIKDKIFNQGNEIKNFTELERKIAKLSKAIAMAKKVHQSAEIIQTEPVEYKKAA